MSKRTKLLNRENCEAEKNLSEESSTIQTDIVVYITKYSFENKNTRLVVILAVILLLTVAAYLLIPNVVIMSPHIAVSAAFVMLVYIIFKVIDNSLD